VEVNRHGRAKRIIAFGVAACYALFTLAVHMRLLDSFDLAVRRASHVGETWGPVQTRAARIVHWLQPGHVALALLVFVSVWSLVRRSLRPFSLVVIVAVPAVIMTLGTKYVTAHWDPGTTPVGHGFPSGHTVSVIIVFGLILLLVRPHTCWGWILPTLMGCLMGWALVLAWVHPATDLIGAGLLAAAVLIGASAMGLGEWASDRRVGASDDRSALAQP
jgi:membrane-associated phospholipid phosphatase